MVARTTTPEIQVAEETGASLSQGAAGGEARTLELACSSWAATIGLDADSDDDEEVAARHTLERGMTSVRRAFDELILPATSVSFFVKDTCGGFGHRRRADGLRVLDLRGADDHLQSGFWRRGGLLSSGRCGGLSDGHLHQLGGSSSSLLHFWCQPLHGHRRGDFAPFGLAPVNEKTSASVSP
jgi:hypothetical protein